MQMVLRSFLTAIALLSGALIPVISPTAAADAPAPSVSEVPEPSEPVRWIIGYEEPLTRSGIGAMTEEMSREILTDRLEDFGHDVIDSYDAMPYVVIETNDGVSEDDLLAVPGVVSVTRDIRLERALDGALTAIQAADAQLNTAIAGTRADGSGRVVVIIDDGIDREHPFFGGTNTRVEKELCVNRESGTTGCLNAREGPGAAAHFSGDWHGTHVAGIAAGSGGPVGAQRGVAQASRIWAAKVFNSNGGASVADINRALQWVYDLVTSPGSTDKVAAVNMSLGAMIGSNANCDSYSASTRTIVQNLVTAGVAVVAAAGNDGDDNLLSWPACMSQVIAVGATDSNASDPEITGFTNLSTALAENGLMAPGSSICSAVDRSVVNYGCASGTSMSSPIVAGAIAVLSQVSALATPEVMRAALYDEGTPTAPYESRQYQRINLSPAIGRMGEPSGVLQLSLRDVTADVGDVTLSGSAVTVSLTQNSQGASPITVSGVAPMSGLFEIPGVPLGDWAMTVTVTGYSVSVGAVTILHNLTSAIRIELVAPTGAISGTFENDPGATTFTLTPDHGNPWPSRTIEIETAGTSFSLSNIRAGAWLIQAAAGEINVSVAVPVTVIDGETTQLPTVVFLPQSGQIQVDVRSTFGDVPFSAAAQVVASPVGEPSGRVTRVVSVPAGTSWPITLNQMVIGEWSLEISGTAHIAATRSAAVALNQTSSVTVTLVPVPRDVTGVVTLPGSSTISNSQSTTDQHRGVDLRRMALDEQSPVPLMPTSTLGRLSFGLTSGSTTITRESNVNNGVYRLSDVPTGTWLATVTTLGYVTGGAMTLVVPPGESSVEFSFAMDPRAEATALSPTSGSTAGGESVVISGIHLSGVDGFFTSVSAVTFGGTPAANLVVAADGRSVTVTAPARSAGATPVQIVRNGTPILGTFTYTYNAPPIVDGGGGSGGAGGGGGGSGGGGGGGGGTTSPPSGDPVVAPVPAPSGTGAVTVPVALLVGELRLGFSGLSGAGAEVRVEPRPGAPTDGANGVNLIGGHLEITLAGATFRQVELCVPFSAADVAGAGASTSDLRLVHFVGEFGRTDITSRIDTAGSRVCGVASSFSAFGIGVMNTTRVSGADRYQTAARISVAEFGPGVPVVYLANGQRFPDALSAAAAAAKEGGPVLLTEPERLPASTRTELIRLQPARVVIAGGSAAVGVTVEQAVRAAVPNAQVVRRQGADRYQTAAAISRASFSSGVAKVFLATGLSFPDALAGAAAAGREGAPVLLVPGAGSAAGVPTAVATELARLNPSEVVILGGTAAITAAVSSRVGQILPAAVRTRVEGRDRYETAARLATACTGTGRVYTATGTQFADALAGAVTAGRDRCPLLLISPSGLTTAVRNRLAALNPSEITVFGGPNAISYQSEAALASYLP